MTKQQINDFKDEMQYYAWLKYSIELIEEEIELIEYDMSGVKSISYDIQVGSTNKQAKEYKRLESIDKYNEKLKKLEEHQKRLNRLDKVLDQMTFYEKSMFLMVFEQRMSYQQVANKFYISKAGLFYRMQRVLERINYEE